MNKFQYTISKNDEGTIFIGNLINGKAEGHGWLISEPKYVGDFKNNLKDGVGRLFYKDGVKIVSEFMQNMHHGKAQRYDPNKKIIVDQIWNMNELVSSEVYFHDGQLVFNKYKNRKKDGIELFITNTGIPIQVMYENGIQIKHPKTNDINGAQGDPDPQLLKENIDKYNKAKEIMDNEITWGLPSEIENQIKDEVIKNKN